MRPVKLLYFCFRGVKVTIKEFFKVSFVKLLVFNLKMIRMIKDSQENTDFPAKSHKRENHLIPSVFQYCLQRWRARKT